MKKTVVILAHPNLENSIGNKTIYDSLLNLKNVSIRNLTALYPDFNIDVQAEQQALLEADLIVLQYPIYWYNMPPILKQWFDKVLTYGFAFGTDYKLEGKKIMASVTAGSPKEVYPDNVIDTLFYTIKASAAYCKLNYLKPLISYDIFYMPQRIAMSKEPIELAAKEHAKQLKNIIVNY